MPLIGQNGAGKSTMIKILTGYYASDAGEILFDGKPVGFRLDRRLRRKPASARSTRKSTSFRIALITENICLGREQRRFGLLDWPAMHAEAEELLDRFNLRHRRAGPSMTYPTAMQQMVAIARAHRFRRQARHHG